MRNKKNKKPKEKKVKNRFWNGVTEHAIDILIVCIGLAISLIEFFWINDKHTGFIILVLTAIMEPILISVKHYIKIKFDEQETHQHEWLINELKIFLNFKNKEDIPSNISEVWKPFAHESIKNFRNRIEGICKGKLLLSRQEITSFEHEVIKRTTTELLAIHMAEDDSTLKCWDPNSEDANKSSMYTMMRDGLYANVSKKRLFIIDNKYHNTELINRVLKDQRENFGFTAKVLYQDELQNIERDENLAVRDMLLRDSEELVFVHMEFRRCLGGEISINEEDIEAAKKMFNTLWAHAKDNPRTINHEEVSEVK